MTIATKAAGGEGEVLLPFVSGAMGITSGRKKAVPSPERPDASLRLQPHEHDLLKTDWPDGVTDGLGAMVAAWSCADEATMRGCLLADVDLMAEVSAYNEVDCRVMMEAVRFFRGTVGRSSR
jgi:hypothetical protein